MYEPQQNPGRSRKTAPSNFLLTVPRRCFCCGLFLLSMFIHFLFVIDLLFILFSIALRPSAGKELSSWLSARAAVILCRLIVLVPFPFVVKGRMWNSIVSVPDYCLFIYFAYLRRLTRDHKCVDVLDFFSDILLEHNLCIHWKPETKRRENLRTSGIP